MSIRNVYTFLFIGMLTNMVQAEQTDKFRSDQTKSCETIRDSSSEKEKEHRFLHIWKAGAIISDVTIRQIGKETCFSEEMINEKLFKRIYSKSFKSNCTIPVEDLRYLKILHYDKDGHIHLGELICHKEISNDLLAIFSQLFDSHYPIERMMLIDNYDANDELSMQANNTSCFNFRKIKGTKLISKHSAGRAIDINPLYNPCVKMRNGKVSCQPQTAQKYMDRTKIHPYIIKRGDLCYQLFKKYGFKWGGDWKSMKDFQHFEK